MKLDGTKKKILQIGYGSFVKAGIQTVIMNITRGLHEGYAVDVLLTSNKPGYYDEEFTRYGTIYRVNCDVDGFSTLRRYAHYCIRPFKQFFYTYQLIRKNGYDIVHIHGGMDAGPMFLAAKAAKAKHIVAHSHRAAFAIPEKRSLFSEIYRRISKKAIARYATAKVGVSQDANEYLYGNKDCLVINNPVELDRFLNAKRSRTDNQLVLSNVGRYDYQKNQVFLLQITKALLLRGYNVKTNLVGFGSDEQMLRDTIAGLGIAESVEMIPGNGAVDIPGILANSDLFVFPSVCEGLGIAAVEAQAAGCLCLASDIVPRETDLGLCEYFSLDAGAEAWADKVIQMIEDKGQYKVNQAALNGFKLENVQASFRTFYNNLLHESNCLQ